MPPSPAREDEASSPPPPFSAGFRSPDPDKDSCASCKPPLAPQTQPRNRTHHQHGSGSKDHRRITSSGERSALSALTESDSENGYEEGDSSTPRSRSVSWDFGSPSPAGPAATGSEKESSSQQGEATPPSILQPILSDSDDVKAEAAASIAAAHRRLGSRALGKSSRKVSLADVLSNPLEDEAETAIIRALEKKDQLMDHDGNYFEEKKTDEPRGHHRVISSILPNIPSDAVHMFEESRARDRAGSKDTGFGFGRHEEMSSLVSGQSVRTPPDAPVAKVDAFHATPGAATTTSQGSKSNQGHGKKEGVPSFNDIASQMRMMQMGAQQFESPRIGYLKKAEATHRRQNTESDKLVDNMAMLYRRSSTKDSGALRMGEGYDEVDHAAALRGTVKAGNIRTPAAAQWNKLRLAVAVTSGHPRRRSDMECEGEVADGSKRITATQLDIETGNYEDTGGNGSDGQSPQGTEKPDSSGRFKQGRVTGFTRFRKELALGWSMFRDFLKLRKKGIIFFCKGTALLMVPALAISAVLFYATDNPILGKSEASYSWWLQFLFARMVVTFSVSKSSEIFFIDFLALRTRFTLKICGPFITLVIVQSKGWPYIITLWSIWNFGLLYGGGPFFKHWLFFQSAIGMFNEENPAGIVVTNNWYFRILICGIVCGVTTALKRLWLAMYLGKRNCEHYGPQLENIMRKMLLLSEVAGLAREIEESYDDESITTIRGTPGLMYGLNFKDLAGGHTSAEEEEEDDDGELTQESEGKRTTRSANASFVDRRAIWMKYRKSTKSIVSGDALSGVSDPQLTEPEKEKPVDEHATSRARPHLEHQAHIRTTQQVKLSKLLDEWEEPEVKSHTKWSQSSIHDVLQYRQALSYMDDKFPFSVSFGPANTRENCIESAQKVYERLLLYTSESKVLPFQTISLLALDDNGELMEGKIKALIRLFRPDRSGNLCLLDFVKSCDSVYKRLRVFRAATANSSQIDLAFENIINVVFYFFLGIVVLGVLRLDPLSLFLSLSSLILGFSFMFGSAASKYFEGILLILVQRPYDIGDRIAISNVQNETSPNGSSTWFVEGVNLFRTTVRFATTNEVASCSNGALANLRIINAARSPKALAYIFMKFGIDVPYTKVKIFRATVESFVKDRPREWIALCGFRATRVEADLGFIEYVIVLQHRESWQNIVPILDSKATLSSFCLEVSKKLEMRYTAPPLPVDLGMKGKNNIASMQGVADALADAANRESSTDPTRSPNLLDIADLFKPEQKKNR